MNKLLLDNLKKCLLNYVNPTVAASGGIDSITLSVFLSEEIKIKNLNVAHAIGPAVPKEATDRVKFFAKKYNWNLKILNAEEMNDHQYVSNPINRCFFCKTNLYFSITKVFSGQVFSGANLDDLNDYRPGLEAAKNASVVHPFILSGMNKQSIRKLALYMGLKNLSKLPSSPCLSSRIQTGIHITPEILNKIDSVESKIKKIIPNADVRCRWLKSGIVIEFKKPNLKQIKYKSQIINFSEKTFKVSKQFIRISKYKRGSAFVGQKESLVNG